MNWGLLLTRLVVVGTLGASVVEVVDLIQRGYLYAFLYEFTTIGLVLAALVLAAVMGSRRLLSDLRRPEDAIDALLIALAMMILLALNLIDRVSS